MLITEYNFGIQQIYFNNDDKRDIFRNLSNNIRRDVDSFMGKAYPPDIDQSCHWL